MSRKSSRDTYLRRKYGITEEQYNELLAQQSDACYICRKPVLPTDTALAVDHDHHSGRIRGLLCFRCNHIVVGRWKEQDIPLLERLIEYLDQGTEYYVPKPKPKRKTRRPRKNARSVRKKRVRKVRRKNS
jgi:hypothetical protein